MRRISGLVACVLASTTASAMTDGGGERRDGGPSAYRAPRDGFGRPDLTGTWTSESLTRMERSPEFGDRLILTPAEVDKLEASAPRA